MTLSIQPPSYLYFIAIVGLLFTTVETASADEAQPVEAPPSARPIENATSADSQAVKEPAANTEAAKSPLNAQVVTTQTADAAPVFEQKPSHTRDRSKDVPNARFALFLNAVSALQWGQSIGFEYGKRWSGSFRFMSLNAGLLSQEAFGDYDDQRFSPGFGLAGRYYFRALGEHLRGAFVGLCLEYFLYRGETPSFKWAAGVLIPSVEGGYRWVFRHFLIGFGLAVGYAIQIHYTADYWFGYKTHDNQNGFDRHGLLPNGNFEIGAVF